MTPEGKIKALVTKMLKAYAPEVWYVMPIGGPYAAKGTPDYICCVQGNLISIETKAKGNKPTKLQELCHDKIRAAGGQVWVIDDEDVMLALESEIQMILGLTA